MDEVHVVRHKHHNEGQSSGAVSVESAESLEDRNYRVISFAE